jgi:hypothetical protein
MILSVEIWNAWVQQAQEYLLVFDAPTRHFLYAVAIGATIMSLIFSYYMTKISLQFAVDIVKAVFEFLQKLGDGFLYLVKLIFTPRYGRYHQQSPAESAEA